jgi:phosphoribosylformylglycinamidine synthase
MLGVIEDAKHITTQWFKESGDVVLLLGTTHNDLGASELLSVLTGEATGAVPKIDLAQEKNVQQACLKAIQAAGLRADPQRALAVLVEGVYSVMR